MAKIIYVHNENDKEVIAEIITNHSMTVFQALEVAGIDMDKYTQSQGWDGYGQNALKLEY